MLAKADEMQAGSSGLRLDSLSWRWLGLVRESEAKGSLFLREVWGVDRVRGPFSGAFPRDRERPRVFASAGRVCRSFRVAGVGDCGRCGC